MRLSYFQFLPLSDFLHLKSANTKIVSINILLYKSRLVTHIISYFFFSYIHQILVHCHSVCFCNRHPFNLLLHCFLCIFIDFYTDFPYVLIKNTLSMYERPVQLYVSILILETVSPILHEMSHSLMVCRSVSMVCVFCSLMFRFTACISSLDCSRFLPASVHDHFLDLLLVLEVSGCFSYNGMGFRLKLPFRIFLCGYRKLFSINRTVYNNISFTHFTPIVTRRYFVSFFKCSVKRSLTFKSTIQ